MRLMLVALTVLLFTVALGAQTAPTRLVTPFLGIGLGLDYGGLGLKGELHASRHLTGFLGAGYNVASVGVNAGLSFKFRVKKYVQPMLLGMYGFNAAEVYRVNGGTGGEVRKNWYGPSGGAGVDLYGRKRKNKVSMAVLYSFRAPGYLDRYPDVLPITISIGYNFRGMRQQ